MKRFDERRVSDLQAIQNEVVYFWQAKQELPQSIDQLRSELRGFIPPRDPETGEAYAYKFNGPLEFELCAVFKASNREEPVENGIKPLPLAPREAYYPYPGINETWLHDTGETCFSRIIDPELFPPLQK